MNKDKKETLDKWGELLDKMGLSDTSTTKINIAEMMEGQASKLLKEDINKERYNQIIDEVYENFEKQCIPGTGKKMSKEEFINICKTNPEFSEKWGLKIEERELSLEERRKLAKYDSEFVSPMTVESWDRNNIPTKLITLTYNNEKIKSYE